MQTYQIKIDKFEGPFDLLLFFIERDELDIYDIPIAKITNDFLSYIKELESLNIDVASEFILVAATLMSIKAKMLIPRKEVDEHGNEIDPRLQLTQQLIAYRQYKEIIKDMEALEHERSLKFQRGNAGVELEALADKVASEAELESINLYKLLTTFNRLMNRLQEQPKQVVHTIYRYEYTIEDQQKYIRSSLAIKRETRFEDLFEHAENRVHAIITFLALLEMLNLQMVSLLQGEGANNFWIKTYQSIEEEE